MDPAQNLMIERSIQELNNFMEQHSLEYSGEAGRSCVQLGS